MENKDDNLKYLEDNNSIANNKLLASGKNFLTSSFKLSTSFVGKTELLDLVEKVGNFLADIGYFSLSLAEKISVSHYLGQAKRPEDKAPVKHNLHAMTEQWYDDNPDMQQYACSEFRKPEYPKFISKPF